MTSRSTSARRKRRPVRIYAFGSEFDKVPFVPHQSVSISSDQLLHEVENREHFSESGAPVSNLSEDQAVLNETQLTETIVASLPSPVIPERNYQYGHQHDEANPRSQQVLHERKKFHCQHCQKRFTTEGSLRRHVNVLHKGFQRYICRVCDRGFSWKSELDRHVNCVHETKKAFQCPFCEKQYTWKGNLQTHINIFHPEQEKFHCLLCEKEYTWKADLQTHMSVVHRDFKPYICRTCNLGFSWKSALERHVTYVHEKKKAFQCPFCQKQFTWKGSLQTHISVYHHGLRPYKCNTCMKVFAQKRQLVRHSKSVHLEDRDFHCSLCRKQFTTYRGMRRHINVLHKGDIHHDDLIALDGMYSSGAEPAHSTTLDVEEIATPVPHTSMENSEHDPVPLDDHYECSECHECFSSESKLVLHQTSSHKEQPVPQSEDIDEYDSSCVQPLCLVVKDRRTSINDKLAESITAPGPSCAPHQTQLQYTCFERYSSKTKLRLHENSVVHKDKQAATELEDIDSDSSYVQPLCLVVRNRRTSDEDKINSIVTQYDPQPCRMPCIQ